MTKRKKTTATDMSPAAATKTPATKMRRFHLVRNEDETGISGTGTIAEGIVFTDGTCVLKWLTEVSSTGIYKSYVEMIHLHGHEGRTIIQWIDEKDEV